jgi:hypothetical protein
LLLHLPFRHSAVVRRGRKTRDERLSFPARATVEIREASALEAPVVALVDGKLVVRHFDGGFLLDISCNGGFPILDGGLEQALADDPALVRRLFGLSDTSYLPSVPEPLDRCPDLRTVVESALESCEAAIHSHAGQLLLADGRLYRSAPEPVLVYASGGTTHSLYVAAADARRLERDHVFRLDRIDYARQWILGVHGVSDVAVPDIDVVLPGFFRFDDDARRLLSCAGLLVEKLIPVVFSRPNGYFRPDTERGQSVSAMGSFLSLKNLVKRCRDSIKSGNGLDASGLEDALDACLRTHASAFAEQGAPPEALAAAKALEYARRGAASTDDPALSAAGF